MRYKLFTYKYICEGLEVVYFIRVYCNEGEETRLLEEFLCSPEEAETLIKQKSRDLNIADTDVVLEGD